MLRAKGKLEAAALGADGEHNGMSADGLRQIWHNTQEALQIVLVEHNKGNGGCWGLEAATTASSVPVGRGDGRAALAGAA